MEIKKLLSIINKKGFEDGTFAIEISSKSMSFGVSAELDDLIIDNDTDVLILNLLDDVHFEMHMDDFKIISEDDVEEIYIISNGDINISFIL